MAPAIKARLSFIGHDAGIVNRFTSFGFKTSPLPRTETGLVTLAVADIKAHLSFIGYDAGIVNRFTSFGFKTSPLPRTETGFVTVAVAELSIVSPEFRWTFHSAI